MIITEYMENGSLDTFLKVGQKVTRMLQRENQRGGTVGGGEEAVAMAVWNLLHQRNWDKKNS